MSYIFYMRQSFTTVQVKGRWESNINVCFRFMYSQKWNWAASLFPKQNYTVPSPNLHIHVSVSVLYTVIPRIGLPVCLLCCSQVGRPILGIFKMSVGIGNEAVQFHFWEYINHNFGTVHSSSVSIKCLPLFIRGLDPFSYLLCCYLFIYKCYCFNSSIHTVLELVHTL